MLVIHHGYKNLISKAQLQSMMDNIFAATLTLFVFVSTSLILYSNDNSVSAANFGALAPSFGDLVKQKLMQDGSNDQTSELPPMEQFPPSQDGTTIPGEVSTPPPKIEQYRVNVKFDQIRVHNDHEGALSGDGEYYLNVYIHGILVDLTKLSQWRDAGLTDVSSGETVQFRPGNFNTVNIDSTLPLTIVAAGTEDDGCAGPHFPANIQSVVLSAAANETAKALGAANGTQGAESNAAGSENKASGPGTMGSAGALAGTAVGTYLGGPVGAAVGAAVGEKVGGYVSSGLSKLACKVNADDKIGTFEESYTVPSYGAGPHTVQSDLKDYTLTYTIAAQRVK